MNPADSNSPVLVGDSVAVSQPTEDRTDACGPQRAQRDSVLDKSVFLDRAFDEYCDRLERGEHVDPDAFCEQFPAYKSSLYRLLDAHRFFQDNPNILAKFQDDSEWPEIGQSFTGFDLRNELGRGSFGRVFLANEKALGNRLVAVKVTRRGSAEANTLGSLEHRNIVPVYSAREDDRTGMTVICMPYLGRATLCDVLDFCAENGGPPDDAKTLLEIIRNRTPLEERDDQRDDSPMRAMSYVDAILHMAIALAEALVFVHSKGILHRDLKPSNVLLARDGQPLLLDFNLSSMTDVDQTRICGTLPYMSPEQLSATRSDSQPVAAAVDVQADLFAFGVMLYELFSGKHPFGPVSLKLSQDEVRDHLLERQREGARPLRELNPRVDKPLASLVAKCIAFQRSERPTSASDLVKSLQKCLSPRQRVRRWAKRRFRTVCATATVASLAIAATIIFFSARDPYGVRQWRHGLECYEEGRFFEAVDCFGQSIDADPNQIAAYFDRGRARMQLSDFWLALGDFEQVRKRTDDGKNDGKIDAAIGHCLVQLGNFQEGAESLKRAIAAGFTTVEVYNDLGYAYFSTGKIPEALDALNEAAQRDPNLQPVLFNRALVYIQIAFTKRDRNAAELGIADLKKAIQLEPHGDLYWHLCTLYLLIERHELALASLEQAARLGSDIHKAEKDRLFRPLFAMAAFVELIRNPPNDAAIAPNTNRLADPLRTIR